MRFAPLALAAFAASVAAPARGDLIAWSGSTCNGAQGRDVMCGYGDCFSFAGRHSFACSIPNRCVSFWTGTGCKGARFNYTNQGLKCTNVNTGTNIQSFRCWAGDNGCK